MKPQTNLENARKSYHSAKQIYKISYILSKDKKLLIKVILQLKKSLDYLLNSTPEINPTLPITEKIKILSEIYSLSNNDKELLEELYSISEYYKENSVFEFSKKDTLNLLSKDLNLKKINNNTINLMLNLIKRILKN